MNFIEAMCNVDFENGEYLVSDGYIAKLDEYNNLCVVNSDNPYSSHYPFANDVFSWDWEIKSKHLTLYEALAEAKKGKKVSNKDWCNSWVLVYVPAIDKYVEYRAGIEAFCSPYNKNDQLENDGWYVVEDNADEKEHCSED